MDTQTPDAPTERARTEPEIPGMAVLAAASAGAAAIHFGMMPSHWAEIWWHGLGFAIVAWLQLGWAWLAMNRPSRRTLMVGVGINVVVLGLYALSRTAGLPGGPSAWTPESVGFIDVVSLTLELVVVLGAATLLLDPKAQPALRLPQAATVLSVLAVVGITTAALASPSATEHHHLEAAGHAHADGEVAADGSGTTAVAHEHAHGETAAVPASERCDTDHNVRSFYQESEITGADSAAHEHAHGAGGKPESEAAAAGKVIELSNMTDAQYQAWLKTLNPATAGPNGDDTTMGGHLGPQHWTPLTEAADCKALEAQIATARKVALSMPHPPDAVNAGYTPVTPYVPGIGSHYMNFDLVDGRFDAAHPEMVLYDGMGNDANVVGLVYYIDKDGDVGPTDGFEGEIQYHRHVGLCVKGTMVIGDSATTAEQCQAMGGFKADGSDKWMGHAWVVPGCESPWGVFSAVSPTLDGALGAASGKGEPCSGSKASGRYDLTPGLPESSN